VLGCADPHTLLLGWHLHLRVLANRHYLQERVQQEQTGLTQVCLAGEGVKGEPWMGVLDDSCCACRLAAWLCRVSYAAAFAVCCQNHFIGRHHDGGCPEQWRRQLCGSAGCRRLPCNFWCVSVSVSVP
jgi:hypothetical protein